MAKGNNKASTAPNDFMDNINTTGNETQPVEAPAPIEADGSETIPEDQMPPLARPAQQNTEAPQQKTYPRNYDPTRRGAVVRDEFGNREGVRKRAVNMGLSSMILPPLTRKTTATYRVLFDENQINPATGKPPDLQPIYIPGTYMLFDKFDPDPSNRSKEMRNSTGRRERIEIKGKAPELVEVVEWVEFLNGVKKVNVESQYRLYVFLELHPLNKTNKHRDKSNAPVFERVDLQFRNEAFKIAQEELSDEAIAEVRKLTNVDKIVGYAAAAGIQTMSGGAMREISAIKTDLRSLAIKDPVKFFSLSNNFKHTVLLMVHEAMSVGIIEMEHDRKRFIAPYTDEPLFVYLPGKDPIEQFVEHIRNTNNKMPEPGSDPADQKYISKYDIIRNMLDFWDLAA